MDASHSVLYPHYEVRFLGITDVTSREAELIFKPCNFQRTIKSQRLAKLVDVAVFGTSAS